MPPFFVFVAGRRAGLAPAAVKHLIRCGGVWVPRPTASLFLPAALHSQTP